uniref:Metalloendopeptidase n=1 Tax=Latimeria chalumnae TaxID=7897 RepID=H3BHY2_LATCH
GSKKLTRQGDMVMRLSRNSRNCPHNSCRWHKSHNGLVYIPYTISSDFNAEEKAVIASSMNEFATLTCVRFVKRTTQSSYLRIRSADGCWSFVGRVGWRQDLSLMKGSCLYKGVVQHELSHAIGFEHEQSRSDRDEFVRIHWENIAAANAHNFNVENTNNLGVDYDYFSIMHYGRYAFSLAAGRPTIEPIFDPSIKIGQRYGLSQLDVVKINRLYQCDTCSFLFPDISGNVMSINHPSFYPHNLSCSWLIRTPKSQVHLEFESFSVQSSPGCVNDYVKIYDGESKASRLLLDKACGKQLLPLLVATGNAMLIEFVTDAVGADTGFRATYKSVKCGGTLTSLSGNFTSPEYPSSYPDSMDCSWVLIAPPNHKVSLTMTFFDLESDLACWYDYLTIQEGGHSDTPVTWRHCGTLAVPPYLSNGTSVLVQFHSDSSIQSSGFLANFNFGESP